MRSLVSHALFTLLVMVVAGFSTLLVADEVTLPLNEIQAKIQCEGKIFGASPGILHR
ncbi:MAG: hypothetical protein R3C11_04360 [Planctomycetaceae bacterium]